MPFHSKKRRGIAQAIVTFLAIIVVGSAVFSVFNYAVTEYQYLQNLMWPTGVFDANSLTFMNSIWTWALIFILFSALIYLYREGQKKKQSDLYG